LTFALDDSGSRPLAVTVAGSPVMVVWAFVVVALIWHRQWFTGTDESIAERIARDE